MDKKLLNFLINNIDTIVYEINIKTKKIKWHNSILENISFLDTKIISTYEKISSLIHPDDINSFKTKLNTKENGKVIYRIKDKKGIYHIWEDSFTYYKDEQGEETIFSLCKELSKEHLTEDILDNIEELFFCKNLQYKYIACNKAFSNFLNLPKEKIIGKDDFEIFDEKFAKVFRAKDIKMLQSGQKRTNKEYVMSSRGEKLIFLTQKSPLLDKNNEVYGLFGISKDITIEMNYKKELIKSRKAYQKIFELNKIPILIICPENGAILNANRAALKFYGYTLKELKNLTIYDINILSKEKIKKEMYYVKNNQKDCFNFKHKTKQNKIIDVEVYSSPISFNKKTVLYSMIFDITKRKKAEEKLNQANIIYQNTKEGIFITNLKGVFLSVNKAFEEITGYKESEVIGKKTSILKSNEHSIAFYKNFWTNIVKKGSWEGEIINKTKSGSLIPQWLTINTIYDSQKKPINYIAVFSDFSKLKKQEQLLREKEQLMFQQSKMASMGEMLRNIAHQWRQPLSAISSSASGLKLKKDFDILEDKDFENFTEGILKSTQYLSETIEDFSNYFKHDIKKQKLNIKEAIEKAHQLIEASLKNYNINLDIKIEENLRISGIKNELVQVILNLLNNSKDAFQLNKIENRNITIKTSSYTNNLLIKIKDNAGGISTNILDKIFEPYFTTKHQSQGTGIGYIKYSIKIIF